MSVRQVYTCYMCGKETRCTNLCKMQINVENIPIKYNTTYNPLSVDICKDCLKARGFAIVPSPATKEDKATNNKCLEDSVLDILRDLGV